MKWRGVPPNVGGKRVDIETASLMRNVGIIAHIDAGKTTLTERLLYYSGMIQSMGEVHDGNATMDFMEEERKRGITVSSAAISLEWRGHRVNLVDTPGHIDFTVEVERSLRVLDGAVVVVDAAAGVQAQTLTVWRQAVAHQVPAIAFVNKMDKPHADLAYSLASMRQRLNVPPLMLQLPLGDGPRFRGVIDLPSLQCYEWPRGSNGGDGRIFNITSLVVSEVDAELKQKAMEFRLDLIERAADLDDELATEFLQMSDPASLPEQVLISALRRITLRRVGLPTFCGSAYHNIGVQPLIDAVVSLLPNPSDVLSTELQQLEVDCCALAFKIVHDKQRGGILTFLRVYRGCISSGQRVYNVKRRCSERLGQLLTPYADRLVNVDHAEAGSIVVVGGLLNTVTGDTLVDSSSGKVKSLDSMLGIGVPSPVFTCTVEASSQSKTSALEAALVCLCREDPSLRSLVNEHTGELELSGMGELHLQIVQSRLLNEYGLEVYMGKPQVAYLETVAVDGDEEFSMLRTISGSLHSASLHLHVRRSEESQSSGLQLLHTEHNAEHLHSLWERHLRAVERGVEAALGAGPVLGAPVTRMRVMLSRLEVGRHTADHVVSAAASRCLSTLLRRVGCTLLQPLMRLEVVCGMDSVSAVLHDLNARRSHVLSVNERYRPGEAMIVCEAPLAKLADYATALRIVTSGSGTFNMELSRYQHMTEEEQSAAVADATGVILRP